MNNKDKNAIANDWKAVGGDIRAGFVNEHFQRCDGVGFFSGLISGIKTLNPFGTINTRQR